MSDDTASSAETIAASRMLDTLLSIITSASSQDAFEAQTILLRRLALQGDVIASRVPAPRNISEIGGYINLLETLGQTEMRSQMLAGILGVAGPNPPLGWLAAKPLLCFVSLINDRPAGAAEPSIPLAFNVRSDFRPALQSALTMLHDRGCALPFLSNIYPLPVASTGNLPPDDVLPYLGRTLDIVPAAALRDPAQDPLALVRPQGSTEPFKIAARVLNGGTVTVLPANWDAQKCDANQCTPVPINNGKYVPIDSILAAAGFYPASPPPQPASLFSTTWARFMNVTGLVAGLTTVGSELRLLYPVTEIAASAFASRLDWVWDGTRFVRP